MKEGGMEGWEGWRDGRDEQTRKVFFRPDGTISR
jgi:hypothetical protein